MANSNTVGYKDVLKISNCRKLLLSNLVNRFGDSIDAIAFTWLVYQITGSATWSAIIFGLNQLPGVFILPFAGAWVEGKNKKQIIIVTDIVRGLVIAGFVVLYYLGLVTPYLMAAFTLIITTVESINEPAAAAFVPEIVQGDKYTVMQSMKMTVAQITNLVGMSIGGIIISAFGIQTAMLIDVATFFIGAIIISFIDISKCKLQRETIAEETYFSKLIGGIKYMRFKKVLIYFSILAVITNFLVTPFDSLMTPICSEVYGMDVSFLSICIGVSWVGAIAASLLLPRVARKTSYTKSVGMLGAILGLALIVLSCGRFVYGKFLNAVLLAGICNLTIGFVTSLMSGLLNIDFVKNVDTDYMARISATFNAIATASMPLAAFIVSLLTVRLHAEAILRFTGIVGLVIFIVIEVMNRVGKEKEQENAKQFVCQYQKAQKENDAYTGAAG